MAISPKCVVSWGLLSPTEGGSPQVISEMEIVLVAPDTLEVELGGPEVELSDE
ncbi:MAG: hypothetical protein ACOZFS_08250 [Thermodesulfobacteriota bacterium]